MNEKEREIFSRVLIDLFLTSPRKTKRSQGDYNQEEKENDNQPKKAKKAIHSRGTL
jgi:hypothetical protein